MSRASHRSRSVIVHLPLRALWIALAAFVAGLLLFAIVWMSNRHDDTFYTVKPADKSGEAAAAAPLPEPMTAQDSASGMQTPAAGAQRDGQPTGAADTFAQPALDQTPTSASSSDTAASSSTGDGKPQPSTDTAAPTQADRAIPLPIDGQSPPPTYPTGALRRGETGTVMVRIQVNAEGQPVGVALIQRSGSRDLDRAAMEAVRKWHFHPAVEDGKPVEGSVEVPVEFNLQR